LNARPLFEGLDREPASARVRIDCSTPSEVARRVAEHEADIALMPVAAAATMGELRFVRGAAIGARGAVRSVVVVAERPIEQIDELAVDLSSRTSVVLARLVLAARRKGKGTPRLLGCTPREATAQVEGSRGALVIGDPALDIEGRFPFSLDLGLAWYEDTGLPLVFAAWCGRAGTLGGADEELLLRAKQAGLARRDALAQAHAERSGLPADSLRAYLHEAVRYDFGDEERLGLERFYDAAARAGLLPRACVRFFDDDARAAAANGGSRVETSRAAMSLDSLLARAAEGDRLSAAEGERLATQASLFDLGLAADTIRRRKHPHDVVTYIVDRNVNYTNVCTTSCRFCAFYRPLGHPEGYVLSREELARKLGDVVAAGGVQILLQGGLHPGLRID
jgi:cyclic dehypoxanthinyl futalosine synthase